MPQPESEVVRVLRAHRLSMNAAEDATMQMMGERWLEVERALNANISALANEMLRRAQTGETITASMIHRAERYQILKSQMAAEISKYNKDAAVIISNAQGEALQMGIDAAGDAIFSSFPSGLSAAFDRINIGAVDSMIGMAGDGSPLSNLLKNDFGDASQGMLDALISGVAQGQGAEAVARQMAEGLAIGLDRSLLIARTELNRSYRAGTTEQYRQSGVTDGFMRLVARDEACLACIALDGEKFASADEMDDHPNGRCTCVPIIAGEAPPEWEKAQDWFANQPESKQLEVLGPARLEMYKNGTPLSAFAEKAHSKEWGDSPKIISLNDMAVNRPEDRQSADEEGEFRIMPDGGIEWVPASTDVTTEITTAENATATLTKNADADALINNLSPDMQRIINESGVAEVRVVSSEEMKAIAETTRGSTCVGLHLEETNSILILDRAEGMERTLIHETAHVLDPMGENGKYVISESKEWLEASGWKQTRNGYELIENNINNLAPTQYAKSSPWEDFAESFAQTNGSRFDRRVMDGESQDRYNFIKQLMEDKYGIKLDP